MKNKNRKILTEFDYFEAIDRSHIILENIDDHLLNHKAVKRHKHLSKKVEKAMSLLGDVYQNLGEKMFKFSKG